MSGMYSNMALIAFILAAAFLVLGGILFFALDIKNVYSEISGKASKSDLSSGHKKHKRQRTSPDRARTQYTARRNVEDEPPTVMENGIEASGSLVGVYEPGAEWADEMTELESSMTDMWDAEERTEILDM